MTAATSRDSIFFVGDIQGCLDPLVALLKAARFDPAKHQLIPVGDTINRGPKNVEVLELLQELQATPILGNHEAGLLKALAAPEIPPWAKGQTWYSDLYPHPKQADFIRWIKSWPVWMKTDEWIAVHGGLHPNLAIEKTSERLLLSLRICDDQGNKPDTWDGMNETIPPGFKPWHAYYKGTRTVIYGHWARQGLKLTPLTRGLDSGCVYGLKLSGLWWPSNRLVQVDGQAQR